MYMHIGVRRYERFRDPLYISNIIYAHVYLWQLLGDPPEDVVVELPGLSQVLHIATVLVLLTPLIGLSQISAISL